MPVPTKLLKGAFATLSAKSLRAAAEYHDLEDWEKRAPASLVTELGSDDGYNLGMCVYDWTLPELKKVAKALGVEPVPSEVGGIRSAIGTFLEEYDKVRVRAKAAKEAAKLPVLPAEVLTAEADRLQVPVVLLKPRGRGEPIAIWSAEQTRKVRGERLWITVDLRRHPDKSQRRNGVLEVSANDAEGTSRATFRAGNLRRPEGKEILLYGTPALDRPCLEALFAKGTKQVQTWLDQMEKSGWKLRAGSWGSAFPFREMLDSYLRTWQAGHPLYTNQAAAQLGGWPLTWPDEGAEQQLRPPLVLRTYRGSEPWIEVFRKAGNYQVVLRVT